MHCSKCKTIITKAVLVVETIYGTEDDNIEQSYCKKCFKTDFMNELK